MKEGIDVSMSMLSINSTSRENENWDCSFAHSESQLPSLSGPPKLGYSPFSTTPHNSITFPVDDATPSPNRTRVGAGGDTQTSGAHRKRSLSALLRLHGERGPNKYSQEEASRVADVLGQWINASSSPYEGEDDFFSRSQDDLTILSRRSPATATARSRGQSESAGSRPSSSMDYAKS